MEYILRGIGFFIGHVILGLLGGVTRFLWGWVTSWGRDSFSDYWTTDPNGGGKYESEFANVAIGLLVVGGAGALYARLSPYM